jgi:hydrogenase expression/formation protein HypE
MERILLGHGSGGRLMHQLIREHLAPAFGLEQLNDSAIIEIGKNTGRLAFTTDSYVVSPLFFPGGNIGDLAVNGTVNDLSVVGAKPMYLTAGFIIEEGFSASDFKRVISSMAKAADKASVKIIAGDTKVVDKGKGDGIFINTSGIGFVPEHIDLGAHRIQAGDKVIVSGMVGNHGIAVMSERNGISFNPPVLSDSAPLNGLVEMLISLGDDIKMMRDPTRGGLATTLKEMALESSLCFVINDEDIPVSPAVQGACDLLGLDPLYIANEGILIAVVSSGAAEKAVSLMRNHLLGANAAIIGEVVNDIRSNAMVLLKTEIGGTRIVDMLPGEQLPRIC